MQTKTREHDEMMQNFERAYSHYRLDREPKELWTNGIVYQQGELNALFLAYRQGYALAKGIYQ